MMVATPSGLENVRLRWFIARGVLLLSVAMASVFTTARASSLGVATGPFVVRSDTGVTIRESREVAVDSATERWTLEWSSPPSEVCWPTATAPDEWMTCPCDGFTFGEQGHLALMRQRPGHAAERLVLDPFFAAPVVDSGRSALQRWPMELSDRRNASSPGFAERVRRRPTVEIMKVGDYDHDGRATEFPLPIGNVACGHIAQILVGISRVDPHLHVFGTALHPSVPLVLQEPDWDRLRRSSGDTTVVEWTCGDHGMNRRLEIHLAARRGYIYADSLTYACGQGVPHRRVLSSRPF